MGNQSCLRFSLEESVWFQRGQEVAELISISLDPNITIQENDQYVTIKGSLELSGEYTCAEEEEGSELEPQLAARQVHSVEEREEGQFEFLHRFPVDITIPQNRIESIYDIDITVESFDYDTPTKNSLKLSAELAITGLYGDQQHGGEEDVTVDDPSLQAKEVDVQSLFSRPETVEVEPPFRNMETVEQPSQLEEEEVASYQGYSAPKEEETDENTDTLYEPFRAEAKKEAQVSIEEEKPEPVLARNAKEQPISVRNNDKPVENETDRKEHTPEPVLQAEPPAEEAKPIELEPVPVETEAVFEEEPVQQGPIINEKAQQEVEEEEESSSSSSAEESPKGKKITKKKGLSIAEFLARKEETEVAKLRVCIVQQDDTLQQIAERYEVSVQQLIHHNHLGLDQDVSEGQVLYVPVGYAPKG